MPLCCNTYDRCKAPSYAIGPSESPGTALSTVLQSSDSFCLAILRRQFEIQIYKLCKDIYGGYFRQKVNIAFKSEEKRKCIHSVGMMDGISAAPVLELVHLE
ncbi:hypothetical protein Plhal703r1_c07g0041861 [Plasmopara halstedii]